jgi:hypothetical protein
MAMNMERVLLTVSGKWQMAQDKNGSNHAALQAKAWQSGGQRLTKAFQR